MAKSHETSFALGSAFGYTEGSERHRRVLNVVCSIRELLRMPWDHGEPPLMGTLSRMFEVP
eukprot:32327-Prorocentrum_minimum.AAC.1